MQRFSDVGENNVRSVTDRDGATTFSYSKQDQKFLDSFQSSYDKMLADPKQSARYQQILSECIYREALEQTR